MSIGTIVRDDKRFKGLTMRYEEGGMVQVFRLKDKEVRLGAMASDAEIKAAFEDSK